MNITSVIPSATPHHLGLYTCASYYSLYPAIDFAAIAVTAKPQVTLVDIIGEPACELNKF